MSLESVSWITRKKLIRIWPLSEMRTDTLLLKSVIHHIEDYRRFFYDSYFFFLEPIRVSKEIILSTYVLNNLSAR